MVKIIFNPEDPKDIEFINKLLTNSNNQCDDKEVTSETEEQRDVDTPACDIDVKNRICVKTFTDFNIDPWSIGDDEKVDDKGVPFHAELHHEDMSVTTAGTWKVKRGKKDDAERYADAWSDFYEQKRKAEVDVQNEAKFLNNYVTYDDISALVKSLYEQELMTIGEYSLLREELGVTHESLKESIEDRIKLRDRLAQVKQEITDE